MIAIAQSIAISCYLGAAALAAVPFARPVRASTAGVLGVLGAGVLVHSGALLGLALQSSAVPITGLGPALSFAGLVLGITLFVVELLARDVSMTLVAAPLAAVSTTCANIIGLTPGRSAEGVRGVWLLSHIALSFIGIAAFATAAAAGELYLVQRRELKSRRFGTIFRFFPPLATLDRVNHLSVIAGWLGLTLGVVLAGTYSLAYRELNVPQLAWGGGAWLAATCLAVGRVSLGWQAQRAAKYASAAFFAVLVLYVAVRVAIPGTGQFL